ncbi:MAG: methylmalonyl Co-A mutase-associated GTPase MeaB [Opitutaceae bacterium]
MKPDPTRPDWSPPDAGPEFAVRIVPPSGPSGSASGVRTRRRKLATADYIRGIESGDRTILARAITLVESDAPGHFHQAQEVLTAIMPRTGRAVRIGITGVPGVGKSTFIEAFGLHLCRSGHRVAVLAIDPSSSLTRGSILGDKTRMEFLSREPDCFIRPSPSSGHLGGVTRKSRETLLLCEAAGFDVILIETVGVGQSEVTVRSMVDFFLLLALTGAGDELQGIKKGVIELADAIVINKADGDNKQKAANTRREYANALHYLHPATDGWTTRATTCSSLTGEGIAEVWTMIGEFRERGLRSGVFEKRRRHQLLEWMRTLVTDELQSRFLHHPSVAAIRESLEKEVAAGTLPVATAVERLLDAAWPR